MQKQINGPDQIFLGTDKDTGEKIFIFKPEWQCGWYWSFGYLGHRDLHYHLSGYQDKARVLYDKAGKCEVLTERRNMCLHDSLLSDYKLAPQIEQNLWQFCELALSVYALKEAAEVIGRGGAHQTANPCKSVIQDEAAASKINQEVLPVVLQTFWDMFSP